MTMLAILSIPFLVLVLIAVFIVGASAGTITTRESSWEEHSATHFENSDLPQQALPPVLISSWQADFSSLEESSAE